MANKKTASADEAATVTLDIVSPSVGVPTPLTFPDLPAHTTIAQLQEKIRMNLTLPNRDAVAMRLIYHGRMLSQPDMRLGDAFGADAFHTDNRRVLHVVLMVPAGSEPPPMVPPVPQSMATTSRDIIAQNQRERAAQNRLGIQDQPTQLPVATRSTDTPLMTSTSNATQYAAPPNPAAVPYSAEQVFGSASDALWSEPGQQMAEARARERANRFAEQLQAARLRQQQISQLSSQIHGGNWAQSQGPVASLPRNQPSQQSLNQQSHVREASGPEVYILNSPEGPYAVLLNNGGVYTSISMGQPTGVNSGPVSSAEVPIEPLPSSSTPNFPVGGIQPTNGQPFATNDGIRATEDADFVERWRQDGQRRRFELRQRYMQFRQQQEQLALRQLQQPQDARRIILRARHPNAQGAGAVFQAIWPHLWLIIRLVLLMLWFTSGLGWSWTRWCGVVAVLLAVIVINSGLLNGRLENVWQPVRQHLERLLPLADQARAPAVGGGGGGGGGGAHRPAPAPADVNNRPQQVPVGGGAGNIADRQNANAPPDPREAAARFVAARREANANWLLDQVRRLERAGLLFLASIAPGVAERHIAHIEAEARAERRRREAVEAEAAAAAAAAAAATAAAEISATKEEGEQEPAKSLTPTDGVSIKGPGEENVEQGGRQEGFNTEHKGEVVVSPTQHA